MIRGRHEDECANEPCEGCQPCAERHCGRCWKEHVDQETCPGCIADARLDLDEITRMVNALPAEVRIKGVESEAMNLLGPAADPEAIGHMRASARVGRIPADWLEVADDDRHPLTVLGTWAEAYVEALEHDEPERITVAWAADYLDRNLAYVAQLEDIPFGDMARDLSGCRSHIERVLHDGEQVELGAPCLKCGRKVRRLTGDDGVVRFRCETCQTDVSEAGYRMAVRAEYIEKADMLTYDDMAIRTGINANTLRTWANERIVRGELHQPLFYSCGSNGQGRKMFRVQDVERVRDAGGDTRGALRQASSGGTVNTEGAA